MQMQDTFCEENVNKLHIYIVFKYNKHLLLYIYLIFLVFCINKKIKNDLKISTFKKKKL